MDKYFTEGPITPEEAAARKKARGHTDKELNKKAQIFDATGDFPLDKYRYMTEADMEYLQAKIKKIEAGRAS